MTPRRRFAKARWLSPALTVAVSTVALAQLAMAQGKPAPSRADDSDAPTTVNAERLSGRPDREIRLENQVEIQRGGTTLSADQAEYDIVDDRVRASGNVIIENFGDRYSGERVNLKMDTGEGHVERPTYRLQNNNAHGTAERIEFESRDRAVIQDGTYSTCEGPDPDWQLRAGRLTLDREVDRGTARNAVVVFKGVPLLASPYLSFPMTGERKSGMLPPSIGTTSRGGLQVQTPYYWNIAPNRDLTLYPTVIAQRGLQLGAQARYLGRTYSGETRIEGMFDDRLAGRERYAFASIHSQQITPQLHFNANVSGASDDSYPNDFTNTITTATQRLLLRDLNLTYGGSTWTAVARTSSYQILQDPLSPIARPYERLPQLNLAGVKRDLYGFDLNLNTEFTNFSHPTLVRGSRMVVNPRVTYPLIYPGFFVTPSASVHATTYNLNNQTAGVPTTFNRVVPTVSVDSGLVFERETRLLGQKLTQTLEPRLFYVYTPYRDQSRFPNFDSALAEFNYTQIFQENRFSGSDRISDANQLTAALSSRFIESSGVERMNLALAQRFYFSDQRVVGGARAETKSDILLLGYGQVSSTISVDSSFQYSQDLGSLQRSNFGVRWRPGTNKVLNVQYRRDLTTPLRLFDVSAQWPLSNRLYGVARLNYSLEEHRLAESVAGVEYKADCWIFRVVAQRIPTATGVSTSTIFLQLELNGLSKIGSNPLQILRTNIPGYQSLSPP